MSTLIRFNDGLIFRDRGNILFLSYKTDSSSMYVLLGLNYILLVKALETELKNASCLLNSTKLTHTCWLWSIY